MQKTVVSTILIDDLLGQKVIHSNRHLGRGVVVNAIFNEYENHTGEILIDIEFALENVRSGINAIEDLEYEIIRFEDEAITAESLTEYVQILLNWLEEEKKEREEELKRLDDLKRVIDEIAERDRLRDEAYNYLISERGVKRLVHFTPLSNLESIFEQGIIPRNEVTEDTICLDPERRDNMLDCSCFSITSPNWSMFYKYRKNNTHLRFVVLEIDTEMLLSKDYNDILFTENNAASRKYKDLLEYHKGLEYAKSIFKDFVLLDNNITYRELAQLLPNEPTDAQAEILVRGSIDSKFIKKIYVETTEDFEYANSTLPDEIAELLEINSSIFERRRDWILSKRYKYGK